MKIRFISLFLLCLALNSLQAQIDRSKMPNAGPAPEINLGTPESFHLPNGLKVLVVENHKLPHVRASLSLDNKPVAEGDKVGIQSLYSAIMGNGTQSMSKDKFNERIDFLGANVGYGAKSAYASSLTKYFAEVFGLMADGLLHPKFSQEEFEDQQKRMVEGIKGNQNNVSAIASNVQGALTYGKAHPYGEFPTVKSVENVSLKDVKSYYHNYISPKNAYLVVVGDTDKREVKKLVKKYFKDWPRETPPAAVLPKVTEVQYAQIDFVDVPNAVQSEVAVINPVHLKKSNPDYFSALIANQILGGGGEGRLFNNLREDKGFTYGAYSSMGSDKYVSRFKASASVRNAVTDSSVVAFLDEINRIRNEKVSSQELELAKAKYTGNFVRALERPSTIARYALSIETDDLPKDFYQNYLKKIKAVTAEDVQRVAKEYFKPAHARIIIAGKGSEVAGSLEKMKYRGKNIPIKYFNKEGEPVEKPDYNKALPKGVTVESVYKDYLKAIGGRSAVEDVKTVIMKGSATIQGMSLSLSKKETKDGKSLVEVTMGGNTVSKQMFNGKEGYTLAQGQKTAYDGKQLKEAQAKAKGGIFPELKVGDAKLTGIEKVDGQDAYAIQTSENTKDYYSIDSGLRLQTVITKTTNNQQITTTSLYSDYKVVKGVKFPYAISQSFGPQKVDFKMDEIKVNEGVSEADFK